MTQKEKRNAYAKAYRNSHKKEIKKYKKEYNSNHKIERLNYTKTYNSSHKEEIKISTKAYREQHRKEAQIYAKIYRQIKKDEIKEYIRLRKETNPLFKLTCNTRKMVYDSLKRKGCKKDSKTEQLIGCSFIEFKHHIETQWEAWMNWDNYGNWNGTPKELNVCWDVDHIIPISTAKTEKELLLLCHYTNLQPLCSYTNRYIKRDNYILDTLSKKP